MGDTLWMVAGTATGLLGIALVVAAAFAGAGARKEALAVYKRLLLEKSLRELLPTTRSAWELAAHWADRLSAMEDARAADLLKRAADASRRKADRMEAVRRVLAELGPPPASTPPASSGNPAIPSRSR
ncbi:MAG: hypothetical protein HUU15_03575 [Candidatus Brocadiae bacterium]|nr:hypothetical protein [Candidatus Brocadiia bacterium]